MAYILVGIVLPVSYFIIVGLIVFFDHREKKNPRSDATRRALEADGVYGRMWFPWRDAVRTTEPDTANPRAIEEPQTEDEKDILRQLELQRETQGWVPRPLGVQQQQQQDLDGRPVGGLQSPRHDDDVYLANLKETGYGRSSIDGPYSRRDSLYSIDVEKQASIARIAPSPVNPYSDINPYSSPIDGRGVHRSASSSTNHSYRHSFDVRRNPFADDASVVDLTSNSGSSFRQQRQNRENPYGDEEQSRRNPFSDDNGRSVRPMSLYEAPVRRPNPIHIN